MATGSDCMEATFFSMRSWRASFRELRDEERQSMILLLPSLYA